MSNLEWMSWVDWKHLLEMLVLPSLILIASLTAGILLNRMINKRLTVPTTETGWQFVFINALRGVPISLCLVTGLYWIVNTINIIEPLVRIFSYILFTVIILSLTRVLARTVSGIINLQIERSQKRLPKTTLLTVIINGIIYSMGILIILQYYGISIAPILTALGVGGMAVALSLQETLANIFSGLHLILSKQLRLGDYIRLNTGEEGRVTDITWRFTTIVPAGDSNMIVIPNQKIASSNITNFSMPHRDIVISVPVCVAYDSDLDQVERVTIEVAAQVLKEVDHDVKALPIIRFHTLGDSSINFNVVMHSSRFDHQYLLKHEFIKALIRRYREEGIEIPYPVRTVLTPGSPADHP